MKRKFYAAKGWALFVLGVLHMTATVTRFDAVTSEGLWFFSAGALMALIAALNLLNRTYGAQVPGLQRVCVAANVANLGLAIAGGIVTRTGFVGWLVVLSIRRSVDGPFSNATPFSDRETLCRCPQREQDHRACSVSRSSVRTQSSV